MRFAVLQLGKRQDDVELTAGEIDFIITRAFNPDASTMRLDNTFGESQSQTSAAAFEACLAGGMFPQLTGLIELGEDDFT